MIWQENVEVIVMVTQLEEGRKVIQCEQLHTKSKQTSKQKTKTKTKNPTKKAIKNPQKQTEEMPKYQLTCKKNKKR